MNAKHPTYLAAVDFSSYSSGDNETASCGSNSCSSSSSASSYRFSAYSGSYVINASRGSNNDSALSTSSSSSSSSSSDGSRPTVMAEKDHQGRLNQSEFAASCLSQFTQERRKQHMESSNTQLIHNKQKTQKRRQQRMDTRKDILMASHSNQKKQPRPQHDDVDRTIHNVGAWGERVQTTELELKDTNGQSRRPSRKRMVDRLRLNMTEVADINESDRNGNGRIHPRCDLYLGLAATYLVLMSSIASSNKYSTTSSLVETAVLTLSSLSFIQTFILGMRFICRPFREYFTSNYLPSCRYNESLLHKLRFGLTFEQFAASVVLLNTCISSGLILYPRYGAITSAEVAVTGNEVWNAILFYSAYISLYGSAYLAVNVFVRDGTTASCSSNQSSIKILLFMAPFSSICTATSLLMMRYGPACSGDYLSQTPYCSSAETAGWLSVWCAMFSSIPCVTTACCHEFYHFHCTSRVWARNRRNSWGRRISQRHWTFLQHLILLGTSTLVLILQSANVAIVSSGGPGHDVGNAFVTSWVAWMISLLLWKNSCVGFLYMISTPSLPQSMCTTSPEGKREKHSPSGDDSARSGVSTTMTEDDTYDHEYSDAENAGQQEDHIVNECVRTALPQHKSGDALEEGHDQFRPDPEERVAHDNSGTKRRVHDDVEGHNLYHSTIGCDHQAQQKASDHSEHRRAAAQDDKKENYQETTKDRSSYDSGSNSDPYVVHHSWNLYHDANRKNVLEVDFKSSTSTQATRKCKRLSQFSSSQCSEQVDHEWDFSPPLPIPPPSPSPPPSPPPLITRRENHQEPKITLVPTATGNDPSWPRQSRMQSFQSGLDTLHETSLDGSSRRTTGTTRSGSTSMKAGSNKSSSDESTSHRIIKDDRNEKPNDSGGGKSPSGGVSSKNSKGTQSRRTPPPPPPPRRNPKPGNKTSRGGADDHLLSSGMAEKLPRINGNKMPAKGLSSTSTAKGCSSFTKEASPVALGEKKLSDGSPATPAMMSSFTNEARPLALGEKKLSDGSSASPVTDGSSATPATMAPKRNADTAAAVAAASHRPLTPKRIASLTDSDLSESDFDILLCGSNSVVTELTLDELFMTPPFKRQDIKMTKLLVDVASASHAAAVSSNSKRTVNSTMEEVFNRFRYKPVRKDSTSRQEQSQSSSPHHPGSRGLLSCESLYNECNESLSKSNYHPVAPGCKSQANPVKEHNHRSTEEFLASSMKEALMSLHGLHSREGCASTTTDENSAIDQSRRRGTIDSRAKRSHDADAQRERRSSAPIKQRRRSQDSVGNIYSQS